MTGLVVRKMINGEMLRLKLVLVMPRVISEGVVKLELRKVGLKDTVRLPGSPWTF